LPDLILKDVSNSRQSSIVSQKTDTKIAINDTTNNPNTSSHSSIRRHLYLHNKNNSLISLVRNNSSETNMKQQDKENKPKKLDFLVKEKRNIVLTRNLQSMEMQRPLKLISGNIKRRNIKTS
jgi:hypothetical protein